MKEEQRTQLRDYAWKYFALHADQRLRTFNFYLLIVAVIVGGLLAYLKDARWPPLAGAGGILLAVLSYVFWRLDLRAREFITHAEEVLKKIEEDIPEDEIPGQLRLFLGEDAKTRSVREKRGIPRMWNPVSWVHAHFGYYHCFKFTFTIFFLVGIGILVAAFFLPAPSPPPPAPIPQQNFYIGNQPVKPSP